MLPVPLENSVLLQNQLKTEAKGFASAVHVNKNPARTLFDVSRREVMETTGPSSV